MVSYQVETEGRTAFVKVLILVVVEDGLVHGTVKHSAMNAVQS